LYGHENELTQTLGTQAFDLMSLRITQEKADFEIFESTDDAAGIHHDKAISYSALSFSDRVFASSRINPQRRHST
jgi:hypothetical protein